MKELVGKLRAVMICKQKTPPHMATLCTRAALSAMNRSSDGVQALASITEAHSSIDTRDSYVSWISLLLLPEA